MRHRLVLCVVVLFVVIPIVVAVPLLYPSALDKIVPFSVQHTHPAFHPHHVTDGKTHEWIIQWHPTTAGDSARYEAAVALLHKEPVDILRHNAHPRDMNQDAPFPLITELRASWPTMQALLDDTHALTPHLLHVEPNLRLETQGIRRGVDWGLDRLDQRTVYGNGKIGQTNDGAGSDVYVIDSGVTLEHEEFASAGGATTRAVHFYNDVDAQVSGGAGAYAPDDFGHGTHVASLVAGLHVGVAPAATIRSVRVLDNMGRGTTGTFLNGMTYMFNHAVANGQRRIAVASLAGPAVGGGTLDAAVRSLIDTRLFVFVAAAGNYPSTLVTSQDACDLTPASIPEVVTVGATSWSDRVESFSFQGTCVDLGAPGRTIRGASHLGTNRYEYRTGTSQAAPLVAGIVAVLWDAQPSLDQYTVVTELYGNTTRLDSGGVVLGTGPSGTFEMAYLEPNLGLGEGSPSSREAVGVWVGVGVGVALCTGVALVGWRRWRRGKKRTHAGGSGGTEGASSASAKV